MEREVQARIASAPGVIYAEITQEHIDQYAGKPFHVTENPVVAAIQAAGFSEASVGTQTAFIGRVDGIVGYRPEVSAIDAIQQYRRTGLMRPFIAKFTKEQVGAGTR